MDSVRAGYASGQPAQGLLVAGDFGTGKSHLLEYLRHIALDQGFVVSIVVVSKETPIYDLAKMYRAAVESAAVPGRRGQAIREISAQLDPRIARFDELFFWADDAGASGLNGRFPASLHLWRHGTAEMRERLIAFWSGGALSANQVKAWMRELRDQQSFDLQKVTKTELTTQRWRFLPRLMRACGYSGWIVLVDECELIGRYSLLQRGKSYAEVARWLGLLGESFAGIGAVLTITKDFAGAVLDNRSDLQLIEPRLSRSGNVKDHWLAGAATKGMRAIKSDAIPLRRTEPAEAAATLQRVTELHARAYGWNPTPLEFAAGEASMAMRQYVRRWINELDLRRLYPEYRPEIEVTELRDDYSEDSELETPAEEDEG